MPLKSILGQNKPFWGKQGPKQINSTQNANNHENLSMNMRVEKFSR